MEAVRKPPLGGAQLISAREWADIQAQLKELKKLKELNVLNGN